jgi:hypothetical protein
MCHQLHYCYAFVLFPVPHATTESSPVSILLSSPTTTTTTTTTHTTPTHHHAPPPPPGFYFFETSNNPVILPIASSPRHCAIGSFLNTSTPLFNTLGVSHFKASSAAAVVLIKFLKARLAIINRDAAESYCFCDTPSLDAQSEAWSTARVNALIHP